MKKETDKNISYRDALKKHKLLKSVGVSVITLTRSAFPWDQVTDMEYDNTMGILMFGPPEKVVFIAFDKPTGLKFHWTHRIKTDCPTGGGGTLARTDMERNRAVIEALSGDVLTKFLRFLTSHMENQTREKIFHQERADYAAQEEALLESLLLIKATT